MAKVLSAASVGAYWCRWRGLAGGVAVLGVALMLPPPVQAVTFNCGAGDVSCLIASINEANANGHKNNTISLAAGSYLLTNVDNDTDGLNGLPSITSHLTIRGVTADATSVARASTAPPFRLLHVAANGDLTVDGMTLTGGGAITLNEGGGGLFNNGVLNITRCTVSKNRQGVFNNGGVVNITESTLTNNAADSGGGLENRGGAVNITRSVFANNGARVAGGLSSGAIGSGGTVRITDSRFTANGAEFLTGGLGASSGTVFIANTTFDHNVGDDAGAVMIGDGTMESTVVITESAFVENSAAGGGEGAAIEISSPSTAVVTNTTFARNVGLDAISNLRGRLILLNSTVADNTLRTGGALFSLTNATTILINSLLARNTGLPRYSGQDCLGPVTSFGNNLIGDPSGCTILLQRGDLTGDPGLGTFRDNGKPGNGHFPLLATSQAIDAGNNAVCPGTDQLGHKRIGPCDIGAIAFRGKDDRAREGDDGDRSERAMGSVAEAGISALAADLVEAVTTLKSADAADDDIFARIHWTANRAAELARGGPQ